MKFLCFLAFFIFILSSFLPNSFLENYLSWIDWDGKYFITTDRIVNKILSQTATSIEKKYKFKPSRNIISIPRGVVKKLGLAFEPRQRFSKQQLRELVVQVGAELIYQINSNEEIQTSLVKRPFTIENVEIVIYNDDKEGNSIYYPELAMAHLVQGIIIYGTNDLHNEFEYHEYEETYEEALQLSHK